MKPPEKIIKKCPYCGYKASVQEFGTWEKEGKRGLLGKDPEGFIHFLCPQCENDIKYDTLSNKFLTEDQKSHSSFGLNLIIYGILALIVYLILKAIF